MQDRFHALLKHRLQVEIEQNPPLFPWESELCEYDAEESDVLRPAIVSSQFWLKQVQRQLPVPMSEQLLVDLMHRCQRLAQRSAQIGRQLVDVVDPLFPGQTDTLNNLAGLVLASAPRSAALVAEPDSQEGFPDHYSDATPTQQMALSLLAVREMLTLLTVTVPVNQPRIERQWMTDCGPLTLMAAYHTVPEAQLCVDVALPCRGRVQLCQDNRQTQAQRSSAGQLTVDLTALSEGDVCTLEVILDGDDTPLTFSLQIG
ncbi:MAG: hypothetical protein WBA10_03700 [Elainellaceae cyanobacterium]